jgi:hypothetical protein
MRTAVIGGPEREFRYELRRVWADDLPLLVAVMLNPSRADAESDDPTIRRLMALARNWGKGGLLVVNLYAFRASVPKALARAPDAVGPRNAAFLEGAMLYAGGHGRRALAAWGGPPALLARADHEARSRQVTAMAKARGVDLYCLGTTRAGHPMHPMARGRHRIPRDVVPNIWKAAA